jgi:hypothetical protein
MPPRHKGGCHCCGDEDGGHTDEEARGHRPFIAQDLGMGHPHFVKLGFQGFSLGMALGQLFFARFGACLAGADHRRPGGKDGSNSGADSSQEDPVKSYAADCERKEVDP